MKAAVSIPEKVFRSADRLAKRLKITRSRLYATAVAEFVAKNDDRKITEQLNKVYGEIDSRLDPFSVARRRVRWDVIRGRAWRSLVG